LEAGVHDDGCYALAKQEADGLKWLVSVCRGVRSELFLAARKTLLLTKTTKKRGVSEDFGNAAF